MTKIFFTSQLLYFRRLCSRERRSTAGRFLPNSPISRAVRSDSSPLPLWLAPNLLVRSGPAGTRLQIACGDRDSPCELRGSRLGPAPAAVAPFANRASHHGLPPLPIRPPTRATGW